MWTTAELKERAKVALSGCYWKGFAVALIYGFLSGRFNLSFNFPSGNTNYNQDFSGGFEGIDTSWLAGILAISLGIFFVVFLFALAFQVFLTNPFEVGTKRYFLTGGELAGDLDSPAFNLIGHAFKSGRYGNIVKTMFLKNLYQFLWSLLFIIPGIIKGYAYAMVPYILADNPEMEAGEAIELSKEMTNGEKMDMFILDLSFLGWWLLGLLACCIGVVFVQPYYMATHAELYRTLREKALDEGICSYEDLGFQSPEEDAVSEDEIEY
jgi:uncharacterized membrane protein